tara:strand:+ start:897 stop:1622 length:726 start_codon:yes stop_codon:yes gene_type:complete
MATTINGSTGVNQVQDDIVTVDKLNLISTASVPSLEAKGSGSQDGYIQLNCYANTHGIKLKSPPHSAGASYTLTFPNNDGDADQFLQTNGSGVMSWAAPSGGGLTLLDTINAASGTTITSSTLNLSTYKILIMDYYSVSPATNATYLQFTPNGGSTTYYHDTGTAAAEGVYALMNHNLASGTFSGGWKATGAVGASTRTGQGAAIPCGLNTGLSTSTTSIAWSWANGVAFDGGTIRIYGLK